LKNIKHLADKIAYLTFSNAATNEAKKRILSAFPTIKDFPYICTMHSLGTKQLNIDTNTQLLKDEKWNAFKNFSQICKDLSFSSDFDPYTETTTYKNDHMKIIEYARCKKISIMDAAIELDKHYSVDTWLTEQIDADLRSYKKQTGMIEYSDMIKQFIEKDKCPPLSVVFLDEAQDLNPLQWEMFNYIESRCDRSYVAGDDDQTIYTFQGANPNIFINLKGEVDARVESRRCPRVIHRKALDILQHVENRMIKSWLPRDAEGQIFEDQTLDNINFSKGEWMIIARTNQMLNPIKAHLTSLNLRFDSRSNIVLSNELLQAYQVWHRLNQGATVGSEEAKAVYKVLNWNMGHVEYGFSSGKSLDAGRSC
jgi:superfamily I DNA/RNA helicase